MPFPSPGSSDPGIKPRSLALQADCLPFEPPGKLTPGYFLAWKQLPSVSVSLPPSCLPSSSFSPPPCCFLLSVWVFLTKMPLCSVPSQPCVVVGRGGGLYAYPFGGRLPCLAVPKPDVWSFLGRPPASPTGQGSLGRLSLFHDRSLSVLQAAWASTGYPGDTKGRVKLGSASLQGYSEPALGPPSTPEQGREGSSSLI